MPSIKVDTDYTEGVISMVKEHQAVSRDWNSEILLPLRRFIRKKLRLAQNGRCAYCGAELSYNGADNCHIDHIAPQEKYPHFRYEPKNFCLTCSDCNKYKRNKETLNNKTPKRYPTSSNAFKIINPHFDEYAQHIVKYDKYHIGISSKVHNTIGYCKINIRKQYLSKNKEDVEDRLAVVNSYISDLKQQVADGDDEILEMLCGYVGERNILNISMYEHEEPTEFIS